MSYSLRVENGDLVVGSKRALEVVTGKEKLFQDLKLWILERLGTDPATPLYGSILDGGVIDGQYVDSFIGQVINHENLLAIKAEVLNILQQYQQMQLAKMKKELLEYNNRHTLDENEILHTINSVILTTMGSTVLVKVSCTTLKKVTFNITLPLTI